MILPGLIGHFIFLWGWLFSFFFFSLFFGTSAPLLPSVCIHIFCVFMAGGLPPSLSALHAQLTVSSAGAAGMVSVLKLGGGGREAKANASDLGLEGWRVVGGYVVGVVVWGYALTALM